MRELREPIEAVVERAASRGGWWAEPSSLRKGLFLVRSEEGVIVDGLGLTQAMTIAGQYNLARDDAEKLARQVDRRRRKSASHEE